MKEDLVVFVTVSYLMGAMLTISLLGSPAAFQFAPLQADWTRQPRCWKYVHEIRGEQATRITSVPNTPNAIQEILL